MVKRWRGCQACSTHTRTGTTHRALHAHAQLHACNACTPAPPWTLPTGARATPAPDLGVPHDELAQRVCGQTQRLAQEGGPRLQRVLHRQLQHHGRLDKHLRSMVAGGVGVSARRGTCGARGRWQVVPLPGFYCVSNRTLRPAKHKQQQISSFNNTTAGSFALPWPGRPETRRSAPGSRDAGAACAPSGTPGCAGTWR